MSRYAEFAALMAPQLVNNDNRRYEFQDYNLIFAAYLPLTYKKFANLFISNRTDADGLDEDACWPILKHGDLTNGDPPGAVQFYLSMPILGYKINDIQSLPFIATGTTFSQMLGDEFKLEVHSAPAKVSNKDIKRVLNSVIRNQSLTRAHISNIYQKKYREINEPNEGVATKTFYTILDEVCDFLNLDSNPKQPLQIKGSPLIPEGANFEDTLFPDITIYDERRIVCVMQVKQPGLFDIKERFNPSFSALSEGNMEEIIKELQVYMITASIRFGAVYDGYHLILVEFEENYSYGNTEKPTLTDSYTLSIPFRTKILNVNSSCPTFLEGLVYLLAKAKEDSYAPGFYKRLPAPVVFKYSYQEKKRKKSNSEIILTLLTHNSGAKLLQRSQDNLTTIYKVKAKYMKQVILDKIDDDEYVVVKIYDPYYPLDYYTKINEEHIQLSIQESYVREWNAVQKLIGVKEYNNIYLRHKQIVVHCFRGAGPLIIGYCIISRYIDFTEIPVTLDVYNQAKGQLQAIVDSGVIHEDIRWNNLLFKDKVYICDFSHSDLQEDFDSFDSDESKKLIDKDFSALDREFRSVLNR